MANSGNVRREFFGRGTLLSLGIIEIMQCDTVGGASENDPFNDFIGLLPRFKL